MSHCVLLLIQKQFGESFCELSLCYLGSILFFFCCSPKCRFGFKQSDCPTRYYCYCEKQVCTSTQAVILKGAPEAFSIQCELMASKGVRAGPLLYFTTLLSPLVCYTGRAFLYVVADFLCYSQGMSPLISSSFIDAELT